MKIIDILAGIIIILLLIYLIIGSYFSIKADKICKEECKNLGGIYYEREKNKQFNIHDFCTCFFEDETKTWRIE